MKWQWHNYYHWAAKAKGNRSTWHFHDVCVLRTVMGVTRTEIDTGLKKRKEFSVSSTLSLNCRAYVQCRFGGNQLYIEFDALKNRPQPTLRRRQFHIYESILLCWNVLHIVYNYGKTTTIFMSHFKSCARLAHRLKIVFVFWSSHTMYARWHSNVSHENGQRRPHNNITEFFSSCSLCLHMN